MDRKLFEEFVNQHYTTIRNKDGAGSNRSKDTGDDSDPLVAVSRKDSNNPCSVCNKILKVQEKFHHVKRRTGWFESCANCRRVKDQQSGQWVYESELTAKRKGRPAKLPELVIPEVVPEPIPEQLEERQLPLSETVTIVRETPDFVELVTVQEYHESVITTHSRIPVCPQHPACGAQGLDNAAHKD